LKKVSKKLAVIGLQKKRLSGDKDFLELAAISLSSGVDLKLKII